MYFANQKVFFQLTKYYALKSCNRPQDKQNIVIFFKELHELFQPAGKRILSYAACLVLGPAGFLGDRFNT